MGRLGVTIVGNMPVGVLSFHKTWSFLMTGLPQYFLNTIIFRSLLGEPIDLGNGHFSSDKEDMIYYLGPERGLIGIDSEWLLMWLENDVVVKTEIARD